ncbi:MAG: DNA polymerase III subunit gamma/tau [Rhizobiaceae bacterium]|nr:DNA polymerase III subunit gamma/tau [Rhizobiaceae bacterium]
MAGLLPPEDLTRSMAAAEPYRVLARKYRPQNFSELIGQDAMVRTLANAFDSGRIAQAWMLTGVRGVGKTTTARILARGLNFEAEGANRPTVHLETEGVHCRAIIEGRHVDVVEMDAASNTGIDDIKQLIDGARYAPLTARYKVYIIDEVHMISEKAFNALLKTLEEPPAHAKFIFATTEIRKVPVTILSRCQRFDLRRVESHVLAAHLAMICGREAVAATPEALAMIARAGDGSVRDSLSILDQAIAHGGGSVTADAVRDMLGLADRSRIIDLFERLIGGDIAAALDEFKAQYDTGANPSAMLADLAAFTHLVTRIRVANAAAQDMTMGEDERVRGTALAARLPVPVLSRTWQMLLRGISEVDASARPFEAAEMVLIRLAHAAHLPGFEDVLRDLAEGRTGDRNQGGGMPAGGANGAANGAASGGAILVSSGTAAASSPLANAPRLAATGRAEMAADAQPLARTPPQPAPSRQDIPLIRSVADIARLADEHRDMAFKLMLKQHVRPVSFGENRIEVALAQGAPKSLYNDLSRRLESWTGQRWLVVPSNEEGGETLAETESVTKRAAEDDAKADPAVAAIFRRFPGAKIIGIRLRGEASDSTSPARAVGTPTADDDAAERDAVDPEELTIEDL